VSPGPLQTYKRKRDFSRTPEPAPAEPSPARPRRLRVEKGRFVIQKHDATRLHYDFRLEAGGVLKSWAVPKGPSTRPADKRLAVMTEDHPLAYERFEGVIPEGAYGGGPVIVWDRGRYINLTTEHGRLIPLADGIRRGHIRFWLHGRKLNGGWSLIRMGREPKQWLLIKAQDEGVNFPPDPVRDQPVSVLSGKTLEQVAANKRARSWHSNR
jgi:DNA ligase D-like protein (predicted 3'-phosphoesterase)